MLKKGRKELSIQFSVPHVTRNGEEVSVIEVEELKDGTLSYEEFQEFNFGSISSLSEILPKLTNDALVRVCEESFKPAKGSLVYYLVNEMAGRLKDCSEL